MSILQCHSKGDKRFSAFYAKIKVNGTYISIEHFYQGCKKSCDGHIVTKGEKPDYIEISSKKIPKDYLSQLYLLMWYQYFLENPKLYEYAKTFDDYCDIFKGKSINNQEDAIRKCCKNGLLFVKEECSDILQMINKKENLPIKNINILDSKEDIIGHQTNCKGVMGGGLALEIKQTYNEAFKEYNEFCKKEKYDTSLLGKIFISKVKNKETKDIYIVDLFGQYGFSTKCRQTDYDSLKKSLSLLHDFAKKNNLSVSIPYNIGCGLAGGDWNIVENIIIDIFCDYPIVLYKK